MVLQFLSASTPSVGSMNNTMNPWGVGYSGPRARDIPLDCACCHTEFIWHGPVEESRREHRCPACRDHSRETVADELVLLRAHESAWPVQVARARELARLAKRAEADAVAEVAHKHRQVVSALRSRDEWRAQVEAVEEVHPDGGGGVCGCGVRGCSVQRVLGEVRARQREARRWA